MHLGLQIKNENFFLILQPSHVSFVFLILSMFESYNPKHKKEVSQPTRTPPLSLFCGTQVWSLSLLIYSLRFF